jgi:hypothetical protein
MNISKNSWHYKVYAWSCKEWEGYIPTQTNLCSYWQTVVFGAPLIALFNKVPLGIVFYGVVGGIFIPACWLVGFKPNDIFNDHGDQSRPTFVRYNSPVSIRGFRLYPWHAVVLGVILFCNWLIVTHQGWKYDLILEGSLLGLAVVIIGSIFYFTSDTWKLTKEVFAAKKIGVCPVVNFIEEK